MVNDMANMVFGVWREKLNSNAVLSAMMVVFAQFLIIKIFDSKVSKNKETNKNLTSCRSMNVPNTQLLLRPWYPDKKAQNGSSNNNEYSLFNQC